MELPSKKPILASPNLPKKEASPIAKKAEPVSPKTPDVLVNKNVKGILPTTIKSKQERADMAEKKRKQAKLACLLKNIATVLSLATIFVFVFMKANISPTNSWLSKFGIERNMGLEVAELENKGMELEMQKAEIENKIKSFENKIENKYYTLFSEDIKKIRESQLTWFDTVNKDGETVIGLIDGIKDIATYLNDPSYKDSHNIIDGLYDRVEIKDISASRKQVSFSATITQILGKIVVLNIEFIDILNSFPIYKNGQQLTSFSREKNEDGDYSTDFSISLEVQMPEEKDSMDKKFIEYQNWFRKKFPQKKLIHYNIQNIPNNK